LLALLANNGDRTPGTFPLGRGSECQKAPIQKSRIPLIALHEPMKRRGSQLTHSGSIG
jgi:hypothetical protein